MNKQEILENYGEYGIPLDIAKTLKEYSFSLDWDLQELKEYIDNCNEAQDFLSYGNNPDVVAVLQFGHFDIEMTIRDFCDGKLFVDYYCCSQGKPYRHNETGWDSFEGADLVFNISQIESKEKLEEIMYNEFMEMAKNHNQYWSKLNN